jgi:hypothetical protein
MANQSGLLALVRGVRAYFEGNNVSAAVWLGWTKRSRTDNQGPGGANRVVFIPGEDAAQPGAPKVLKAGVLDRMAPQQHVTLNPRLRALAWWHEPVTVSVWAVDADHPQDEEGQIAATEDLLELTIQALHNAVDPTSGLGVGFANIEEWGPPSWTLPPVEAPFGRELTFSFVLLVPLFDQPQGLAFPGPVVTRKPPA